MSSNRHRVQEVLESHLGCSQPDQLHNFRTKFEELVVDARLSAALSGAAVEDARSTYFKAVLSLLEGALSVDRGFHSWAVVKLYYSAFYLVRFAFLIRSIGIFRCKQIYTLSTAKDSRPVKRNGKGDHKVLIKAFSTEYRTREKMLSNGVGDIDVFEWLMDRREHVHYKNATFHEPNGSDFIVSLSGGRLIEWLERYISDEDYTFCFDADHATLAAPFLFCSSLTREAKEKGITSLLTEEQQTLVEAILRDLGASGSSSIRAGVSIGN